MTVTQTKAQKEKQIGEWFEELTGSVGPSWAIQWVYTGYENATVISTSLQNCPFV